MLHDHDVDYKQLNTKNYSKNKFVYTEEKVILIELNATKTV